MTQLEKGRIACQIKIRVRMSVTSLAQVFFDTGRGSFAFIYRYCDPVGAAIMDGFQSRYLPPLALGLVFVFNLRRAGDPREAWPRFFFTGIVRVHGLLLMMATVAHRFYPV